MPEENLAVYYPSLRSDSDSTRLNYKSGVKIDAWLATLLTNWKFYEMKVIHFDLLNFGLL